MVWLMISNLTGLHTFAFLLLKITASKLEQESLP